MAIGQSDKAVDKFQNDKLKMGLYAKALAKFVLTCQTPMTIGIQGEWGSGKSSLMGMMQQSVEDLKEIYVFNFETWQYSVGGDDELLGVYLISKIVEDISNIKPNDKSVIALQRRLLGGAQRIAGVLVKSVAVHTINQISGGVVDGQEVIDEFLPQETVTVPQSMARLRTDFSQLVKAVANSKKSRIVIFIDDLDRVRPARAISMLEMLKNFMDVEGCVFVVACDYEVVREGVKHKFGIQDERKARAFFEKIIQVPFQMPVHSYKVFDLLKHFFDSKFRKDVKSDVFYNQLIVYLSNLVEISVGRNPRAFKRFLNSLDLYIVVWLDNVGDVESNLFDLKIVPDLQALVSLLALQNRWPNVASYLTQVISNIESDQWGEGQFDEDSPMDMVFQNLQDILSDSEGVDKKSDLYLCVVDDVETKGHGGELSKDVSARDLRRFVEVLQRMMQLGERRANKREYTQLIYFIKWSKNLSLTDVHYKKNRQTTYDVWAEYSKSLGKNFQNGHVFEFVRHSLGDLYKKSSDFYNINILVIEHRFYAEIQNEQSTIRIFSINAQGKLSLGVGEARSSILAKLAPSFILNTESLGMVWRKDGKVFQTIDLVKNLNEDNVAGFFVKLLEYLRQVESSI